jgi:hypothetical protein
MWTAQDIPVLVVDNEDGSRQFFDMEEPWRELSDREACYWLGYDEGVRWLLYGDDEGGPPIVQLDAIRELYESCPRLVDGSRKWTLSDQEERVVIAIIGIDPDGERDSNGRLVEVNEFYSDNMENFNWTQPETFDDFLRGYVEGVVKTYHRLRRRLRSSRQG